MVNYLLFANVIVFLVLGILYVLAHLTPAAVAPIYGFLNDNLSLHSNPKVFITKPWGIITYMFVQLNVLHILFNMLVFYWYGNLFRTELGNRRVLPVYILGGIVGGLFFMLLYQVLPGYSAVDVPLIGASAAVMAFLLASATVLPNLELNLFIFGYVKLKYIAAAFLVIDLVMIPFGNWGGIASHLGGALFGYLYVSYLRRGVDMAQPLIWLFTKLANMGSGAGPGERRAFRPKKSPLKVVKTKNEENVQQKLDILLDKINEKGYNSLSSEEKKWLKKYSDSKD